MMNRVLPGFLVIIGVSCLFLSAVAQTKKSDCPGFQDTVLHKFVYKFTDVMPEPQGGIEKVFKLITKYLKYPTGDASYSGRVIVAFVIEPNGSIDGQRTMNDPSGSKHVFSKQLLDILGSVKWKPGYCNGKAVPVLYSLPVAIEVGE